MAHPSPEMLWNASKKEIRTMLDAGDFASKSRTVRFYAPSFTYYKTNTYNSPPNSFPTFSVTAAGCALDCKHCGGKVLQTMQPTNTPERLLAAATSLKKNDGLGCLVSGGCLPDGSVPLAPFTPTLKKIKGKLGLTVFVHTGIIDHATALELKEAGVDAALIDVIGSDETVKEVCKLNISTQDYLKSLKALNEAGLSFVPHIVVGLHFGELKGEFQALRMVSSVKPSALVIIAFMPIRGTEMANIEPPQPTDIAKVTAMARLMFPQTPLALGCMRPKGKHRALTDVLALKAGVDAIVFPSQEAIRYAQTQDYAISFSPYCCAQIYSDSAFRSSSK
jgi:lipoyl synthase